MINLNGRIYDIVVYTFKTGKKATLSCMNELCEIAPMHTLPNGIFP